MNENQKVVYNHFKSRASNDYEMSNTTMTANLRCLGSDSKRSRCHSHLKADCPNDGGNNLRQARGREGWS